MISSERLAPSDRASENKHINERNYDSFERIFTLPLSVDADKAEASFKDGVLQVAVPKSEAARPRLIKISDGKSSLFSKILGAKDRVDEGRNVKEPLS